MVGRGTKKRLQKAMLGKSNTEYYVLDHKIRYFDWRSGKNITLPIGYESDGASGAIDIYSDSWWVHDWILGNWSGNGPKPKIGEFDDGSPLTNKMASQILSDILRKEGRNIRAQYWYTITFLFGGAELKKKNGWW